MKARAFIALGSNLGDSLARVDAAFDALARLPATRLKKRSPRYRNRAVGPGSQPDFVNAVAELDTGLGPFELLDAMQNIETDLGREPNTERWAPRLIDLDLLLYGDLQMHDARLILPHPEMHRRRFVLEPLSDIAPELEIPGRGPLRELLRQAPDHELIKVTSNASTNQTV